MSVDPKVQEALHAAEVGAGNAVISIINSQLDGLPDQVKFMIAFSSMRALLILTAVIATGNHRPGNTPGAADAAITDGVLVWLGLLAARTVAKNVDDMTIGDAMRQVDDQYRQATGQEPPPELDTVRTHVRGGN